MKILYRPYKNKITTDQIEICVCRYCNQTNHAQTVAKCFGCAQKTDVAQICSQTALPEASLNHLVAFGVGSGHVPKLRLP